MKLWMYALHMGRTNVELDDALVARVMQRYGVPTKRAAIDLALRRLDLEPMSREEALAMEGTGWEGDLEELRGGWARGQLARDPDRQLGLDRVPAGNRQPCSSAPQNRH